MCAVSMMQDWGRTNIPNIYWTPETLTEYQQIIKMLEELDHKLGLVNCEDPAKAEWMKAVEARLKKLEGNNVKGFRKSKTSRK